MKTAKFYGVVYDVRPTGKKRHRSAKSFVDFNGYEVDREAENWKQMGLYLGDVLHHILSVDMKHVMYNGRKAGQIHIKETQTEGDLS